MRDALDKAITAAAEANAARTPAQPADAPLSDSGLFAGTNGFIKGMAHYQGDGAFDESKDLKPIEQAFEQKFDRPLPISADGETNLHRSLGLDHRGRVDVAVNPKAPEGVWLLHYLESLKIPYYAFTHAMRGKATAAHIHIGPGSTRLNAD